MKKTVVFVLTILVSNVFFGQNLKTISNLEKNYQIDVPENWEENKMFYSSTLSLMVVKPKSDADPKPQEAIGIKHAATSKTNFNDAFKEYHGLLIGYYKSNFNIIEAKDLKINGTRVKKLITEVTSRINGEKKKNIMIFAFVNQESMMITLTSSPQNYTKNIDLYKKIYTSLLIKK